MKIAISGTRNFDNYAVLEKTLQQYDITQIIAGGATGADALAEKYAIENGIEYVEHLPLFKVDKSIPYHPKWYLIRNKQIVDASDMLIAFWDNKSKGTKFTINHAAKSQKPYIVIPV